MPKGTKKKSAKKPSKRFKKKPNVKSPTARKKVAKVMQEFHKGDLKHAGTGKSVPKNRPDIARAIALSEGQRAQKKSKTKRGRKKR